MSTNTMIILLMVGLFVLFYAISYIVRAVVNKGADMIGNAIADKKNKEQAGKNENLADRYKN